MVKKIPVGMSLALVAAMGLAFWAGRNSVPDKSTADDATNNRVRPRSTEQPSPRRSSQKSNSGPGAGAGAVTTALQLRDIFQRSGDKYQAGIAIANATLAKMNGSEVSQLVHDLAAAKASTPGYVFTLEISTACSRWAEIDPDAALKFALANKQSSFRSAAIGSIFAGMAKNDPALARAKLAAIEDPSLRASAKSSIMSALMTASPDDWVDALKSDPSLARQYGGLGSIATEWAMDDPVKAAERLRELPESLQKGSVTAIAQVWGSKDSSAAIAWAQSLTDGTQRNMALGAIAGGLAAKDPDAALASLDSLPPAARKSGLAAVFRTLADLDYEAALAKATSLSDPADQKAALRIVAGGEGYASNDPFSNYSSITGNPEQLNALLDKLPPGTMRNNALGQLGQQLASFSREEAESILAAYPAKEQEKLQSSMLQTLSYRDPARALEVYQSLPPGKAGPLSNYSILENLGSQNPEALLKFSLLIESKQDQTRGVTVAFAQFAREDPLAASHRLASLPPGPMYDAAVTSVAGAWARTDPDAARAWVETLPVESKTRAIDSLIPSMAASAPKAAAEMIGTMLASSKPGDENKLSGVVSQLSNTWAQDDPEATGKWISGLPDGDLKTNAIRSMMQTWSGADFDGATKWIDTLPDGKARDSGVQAIVSNTSYRDPATAFEWANTIGDDSQRSSALSNVVSQWKNNNPDKARAAVNRADLSDAERTRLLKQLE